MLRIALAQTRQTDDFDDNVAAIFEAFDEAAGEGAQVVCFPEAQTVGYRVDSAQLTHMKIGETSITGLRPSASLSVPASGFRMKPKAEAVDSSSDCAATCAA